MSKHTTPPAHVEVIPALPEQAPILANLLELYAHDFSEFLDLAPGPDGRFGYAPLPLYWSEAGRHAFLCRRDGALSGFVLVKKGSEFSGKNDVWDMAEFFVLRGYRRHGLGTQIAHEVWRRIPGPWEVRVMESNAPAAAFWAHAISAFTGATVEPTFAEKDGRRWAVFGFESE